MKIEKKNLDEGVAMIKAATSIDELIEGIAHVYGMTAEEMAGKKDKEWTQEVGEWIENVAAKAASGEFKPTGERRKVGFFDEDVLAFLKARGIELSTDEISISDRDIMHALRTAKVDPLPVSMWKRLPSLLANPLAVYWDSQNPGVIFVLEETEGRGKIIVKVNYEVRDGGGEKLVNVVRTGKLVKNFREFLDKTRYITI